MVEQATKAAGHRGSDHKFQISEGKNRFAKRCEGRRGEMEQMIATSPEECTFAKMSVNYSADLRTRVEPCFYGGAPDCSQCGCVVTAGLHWVGNTKLLGLLRASHVMKGTIAIGLLVNKMAWRMPKGIPGRNPSAQGGDNLMQPN